MKNISASLVLYQTSKSDVLRLLNSVSNIENLAEFFIVDNSPLPTKINDFLKKNSLVTYHHSKKNLGYGAGHNIALKQSLNKNYKFHLIINPDIYFEPKLINEMIDFLNSNKNVGQLMPKILNVDGSVQRLAKLLPSPFDLFVRGFFPNNYFLYSRNRFILKSYLYDRLLEVPYLSGCFMCLRMKSIKDIGIFDERYFMYPEDIDLTRRMHKKYKTIVYPFISVIHRHEKASSKSLKMKFVHIFNMIKYFNKWGWFIDSDRYYFNKKTLKQLE